MDGELKTIILLGHRPDNSKLVPRHLYCLVQGLSACMLSECTIKKNLSDNRKSFTYQLAGVFFPILKRNYFPSIFKTHPSLYNYTLQNNFCCFQIFSIYILAFIRKVHYDEWPVLKSLLGFCSCRFRKV